MKRAAVLAVVTMAATVLARPGPALADLERDIELCRIEKNLELAYQACTRALAVPGLEKSKRRDVYFNRAIVLDELGREREAIADYGSALKLLPSDHKTFNERGRLYRLLKDYDLAIADFSRAIELAPNESAYLSNRGMAHKLKGDFPAALQDYDAALLLEPDDDATLHNRGALLREMKIYLAATADLTRSLELDPDDAATSVEIGLAYADQKFHRQAIAYYDRAIAQSPRYAVAWRLRGESRLARGELDLALRDLDQAEALGDRSDELWAAQSYARRAKSLQAVLSTSDSGSVSGGSTGSGGGSLPAKPANPDFDMGGELDF